MSLVTFFLLCIALPSTCSREMDINCTYSLRTMNIPKTGILSMFETNEQFPIPNVSYSISLFKTPSSAIVGPAWLT